MVGYCLMLSDLQDVIFAPRARQQMVVCTIDIQGISTDMGAVYLPEKKTIHKNHIKYHLELRLQWSLVTTTKDP